MRVDDLKDSDLVTVFIQLRDRRAERKAKYENEDASDKSRQDKIEAILLRRFNEQGIEAIKTGAGTAYKNVKQSCSVADWDAFFMDYVVRNQAWELINRSANKDSVRLFINEHDGQIPPGINWREVVEIGVRRST